MLTITGLVVSYRLLRPGDFLIFLTFEGTTGYRTTNTTFEKVQELIEDAKAREISTLSCPCTGTASTIEGLSISLASSGWDKLEQVCLDATDGNDYRGLCYCMCCFVFSNESDLKYSSNNVGSTDYCYRSIPIKRCI